MSRIFREYRIFLRKKAFCEQIFIVKKEGSLSSEQKTKMRFLAILKTIVLFPQNEDSDWRNLHNYVPKFQRFVFWKSWLNLGVALC